MSASNLSATGLLNLATLLPSKDSPLSDSALFASHPLEFLRLAMQLSGDLAYVSLADAGEPASVPTVKPIQPNLVKQVFTHKRTYHKPAQSAIGMYLFGRRLVTSTGNQWKRQRQVLQPAFHREVLASIGALVTRATEKILAGWRVGQAIDVAAEMTRLTLRILGRTLFGTEFPKETDSIGQAITTLLSCVHEPGQQTPSEVEAALRTLDTLIFQVIIAHRRSKKDDHDLLQAQHDDPSFFTDQLVRDGVMTFLIAGPETTTVALAWTWYFLAEHPEVERTLHTQLAEVLEGRIPTIADLPHLSYARSEPLFPLMRRRATMAKKTEQAGKTEQVVAFLCRVLGDGPLPSKKAWEQARKAGYKKRTYMRARAVLRVQSKKRGYGGRGMWVLSLPLAKAQPFPTQVGFERTAHVTGLEHASAHVVHRYQSRIRA